MEIVRYVVTYVDTDENGNCDGKAGVVMVNTEEEAKAWIRNDMEHFIDVSTQVNGKCDYIADFDKMNVHTEDWSSYCEWGYNKKSIELTQDEINTIKNS